MVIFQGIFLAFMVIFQGCNEKEAIDAGNIVEDVVKLGEDAITSA